MSSAMRFKINRPMVIQEVFEDEVVIVNLEAGSYYSLNPSGGEVWRLLDQGASTQDIAVALAARYKDESPKIRSEIDRLIDELVRENLISPAASSGDAPHRPPDISAPATKASFESPIISKYTDMKDILLLDPIHEVDEAGWPNKPAPPGEDK